MEINQVITQIVIMTDHTAQTIIEIGDRIPFLI